MLRRGGQDGGVHFLKCYDAHHRKAGRNATAASLPPAVNGKTIARNPSKSPSFHGILVVPSGVGAGAFGKKVTPTAERLSR
jgi:hypothetical protein